MRYKKNVREVYARLAVYTAGLAFIAWAAESCAWSKPIEYKR